MKASYKHIRVRQGFTTKVYRFYADSHCTRVEIRHNEMKPVIFRNTCTVNNRLVHKYSM